MTHVGFTGTQKGLMPLQRLRLTRVLADLDGTHFHHGDCVGADEEAHVIALDLGILHLSCGSGISTSCATASSGLPSE